MKKILLTALILVCSSVVNAQQDVYGHQYKHQENLSKDKDKDGYIGLYDYNDANKNVTTSPSYTPSSSYSGGNTYTGPRGGSYTITPSGNKRYIKR